MAETVKQVLETAKNRLKAAGIETWSIDADLLTMQALELSRVQLVTRDTEFVSENQLEILQTLLEKRLKFMPVQYILKHCEFMGLDFEVNENVLIPRPDTEVLVETVLETKGEAVLDIGTGSGAIAVALAKYGSRNVTAVDISEKALEVARKNAANNGVKVDFIQSNLFENVSGKFDIVVSNPPYIESDVVLTLDKQVKDFEPHLALDGGEDGLVFYKKIVSEADNYLNADGTLAFEIGYNQGSAVRELLLAAGYRNVRVIKDLAQLDRVVIGHR